MNAELSACIKNAMDELAEMNANGINIHGKKYTTVAKRVEVFRKHLGAMGAIVTEILHVDNEIVRAKAMVYLDNYLVAMGHAEEVRAASSINRTSAVEVCETSAIGRALAALGLHGGEYASANEVEHAIEKQNQGTQAGREARQSPKAQTQSAGRTQSEIEIAARSVSIALSQGLRENLWEIHEAFNDTPEDYGRLGAALPAKDRGLFKDIIREIQAEKRVVPSANGRSTGYQS